MPLFPAVGRRAAKMRASRTLLVAVLLIGVALQLFPFYFMITTSFSSGSDTISYPPSFWPKNFSVSAWKLFGSVVAGGSAASQLMDEPFWRYFANSLFIAVIAVGIGLPVTSLAAYANSKLLKGRTARWSFLFFIGTMMVPFVVTLIPMYLLTLNFPFAAPSPPDIPGTGEPFPTLRLWNTPWAVILPAIFVPFGFLMFKGFFDTIPDSVINAARVDGGSEINIFRRIVLPMSVPVYAVVTYLNFGSVWDNFLWQLVVLQDPAKLTSSVALYDLMNKFSGAGSTNSAQASSQSQALQNLLDAGLSWNGLMVLGLLQTLPIFVAFVICRRYLLRGIQIRGLK